MLKNKKMSLLVSVIIILIVVVVLVFITINKKENSSKNEEQNINMENTQAQDNSGVKITVIKEGSGEVVAKAGDSVTVNYTGSLVDGTVFDSNVDPKFKHVEPFNFGLGAGQVIKGWDIGVAGMKIGEVRKLEIAPELAYGPNGIGGVIPPNSTLVFQVELLKVNSK